MKNDFGNAMSDNESVRVVAFAFLSHEGGLHARPAIKVSQLAKRFQSRVWLALSEEGPWIDAKSVARVIAMKAPSQIRLFFAAEGDDANDAVGRLVDLVASDFENGAAHARESLATVCLSGIAVSPGLARGPLVHLEEGVKTSARRRGAAEDEAALLRSALDASRAELGALMARTDDTDAETILAFQVAMLEDTVVTSPAFEAIAENAAAAAAWRAAMDLQIREFHEAEDLYFRARASDLRDVRDRVLRHIAGDTATLIPPGAIVVTNDLPPSRFLEVQWNGGGVALLAGSPNSHVAMLARSHGVPMMIGIGSIDPHGHEDAILDTENGVLVLSPDAQALADLAARQHAAASARAGEARYLSAPAVTAQGETVQVLINVADANELERFDPGHCDGIGLVRTELLLRTEGDLENEQRQYELYERIMCWALGKPVTIRTLDAGGDKPIAGYTIDGERNPFLGVRGVRLSLVHPRVLNVQLRALARAAVLGPLKIMVPMVTRPHELDHVRLMLNTAVADLRSKGVPCAAPELGIMVEVPATALTIDLFEADFFSIGSNDLIQYVTASSRDASPLAALQDPLQPAVLRLIHEVVEHANAQGIAVSVCGDMASDVRCIPALLGVGMRCLSVAPAAVGRVKAAIARYRKNESDGGQAA
jgi:phosphotransferase system enzyme I (PtsI)